MASTLNVTETIELFKTEVSEAYPTIRLLQKVLFNLGSPSKDKALSSARCMTIFTLSELKALFLGYLADVAFLDTEDLSAFSPVGDILSTFHRYQYHLRNAIAESKAFLPMETVRVLEDFNSPESSLNQLNVAIFLILTANLRRV